MSFPTVAGSPATCGHPANGNPKVLIEGKAASVITQSTAGGVIIGPGSPRVTVTGIPVSVAGDSITPHGKSPHNGARTTSLATRVTVP